MADRIGNFKSSLSIGQLANGFNSVEPIGNSQLTVDRGKQVDRALEDVRDLITEDYKRWYAKQALRLGVPRFMGLAHDARQGKRPAQLFSYLLKRA